MTTLTEKIRKRSTHEVSMAIDTALREGDKVKMLLQAVCSRHYGVGL